MALVCKAVLVSALTLTISGCFGGSGSRTPSGGGGRGAPAPITGDGDPAPFETAEYLNSSALGRVNASQAYADGFTGDGIAVAVVDSGIDADHPEFEGQIAPGGKAFLGTSLDDTGPVFHGTLVAGVIAARKNDEGMHGIAYDAQIIPYRACDGDGVCSLAAIASSINAAVANNAKVINLSLGASGTITPGVQAAIENAVNKGVIVVAASGNESGPSPLAPGNFAADPKAKGLVVVVGAVDQSNVITTFSNQPGSTKNFYIVAPGTGIQVPIPGGDYGTANGTSFAAPLVSGAIAIMLQRFPNLKPEEIVQILFETAQDLGEAGVDAVYGRGLLDLANAITPQGVSTVMTADGKAVDIESTQLYLSGAFGDAILRSSLVQNAIIVDKYNRSFNANLAGRTTQTPAMVSLQDKLAFGFDEQANGDANLGHGFSLSGYASKPQFYLSGLTQNERAQKQKLQSLIIRKSLSPQTDVSIAVKSKPNYRLGLQASPWVGSLDLISRDALRPGFMELAGTGHSGGFAHKLTDDVIVQGFYGRSEQESSLSSSLNQATKTRMAGVEIRKKFEGGHELSAYAGSVQEKGRVLGSQGSGALSIGSGATTTFVGAAAVYQATSRFAFLASYTQGYTTPRRALGSVLSDVSEIDTATYSIGFVAKEVATKNDSVSFTLSQPLRVTRGRASAETAVGVSTQGDLIYAGENINLAPSARQIDLEIAYNRALDAQTTVGANALYQMNPGHSNDNGDAQAALIRLQKKF